MKPGDYDGVGSDNRIPSNTTCDATGIVSTAWPNICPGNADGKIEANGSFNTQAEREYGYARNHLIYEGFLNDSFRHIATGASGLLMKFPRSYGTKIMAHFVYNTANANNNLTKNANGIIITDSTTLDRLAYQIDKKIDDGYPKSGILGNQGDAACLDGDSYNFVAAAATTCQLFYKLE